MKKIIVALSLIALLGAGCAKAPTSKQADENKVNVTPMDTSAITFDSKTDTTAKDQKKTPVERDENGTPIIDVSFGGDAWVRTIDLKTGNFFFEPKVINAKPGEKLRIDFRGTEGTHTFVIDEANVKQPIKDGSGFEFTAPEKAGSYAFYCDIGNHRKMGMEGTLIVK